MTLNILKDKIDAVLKDNSQGNLLAFRRALNFVSAVVEGKLSSRSMKGAEEIRKGLTDENTTRNSG